MDHCRLINGHSINVLTCFITSSGKCADAEGAEGNSTFAVECLPDGRPGHGISKSQDCDHEAPLTQLNAAGATVIEEHGGMTQDVISLVI
jgi:hypothetical protein